MGGLTFLNVVGDVRHLHRDPRSAGAVFQVASQFNCLEMVGPEVRPENGITNYAKDKTQGPACALSCPAATVFRNYFVNGQGQAGRRQLDLLQDVACIVGNRKYKYWEMTNGYCLPTTTWGMAELGARLSQDEALAAAARAKLRVGIHWSTQVAGCKHKVCQIFCSALPVSYVRGIPRSDWGPFARTVLEAAYDATLAAAASLTRERQHRVAVYLTALGGGSFGNEDQWIVDSLAKALRAHASEALDVKLVHFRSIPDGPFRSLDNVIPTESRKRSSASLETLKADGTAATQGRVRRRLTQKTCNR